MALGLGVNPDLSVVQGDYDKDGTAEPVVDELAGLVSAGLVGTTVTVLTTADGSVLRINKIAYVEVPK